MSGGRCSNASYHARAASKSATGIPAKTCVTATPALQQNAKKAARQWGVLSLSELRACGLSGHAIWVRVGNRRLPPLHRGVYAVGHANPPLEGIFLAAVKACGRGAVLSHFAAAALWGIVDWDYRLVEVTVPRDSSRMIDTVHVHRSLMLAAEDVRWHKGMRVTSPVRTLID